MNSQFGGRCFRRRFSGRSVRTPHRGLVPSSHWVSGRFSHIQEVAAERRHRTAEEKGSSSWTNLWTGTPTIKGEGPERSHTSRTIKDGNKLTAGVMSSGAGPLDSTPAVSGNQTSQLFISGDFTRGRGVPSMHCSHQNRTTFKIFYCFKIYIDLKSQKIKSLVEHPQSVCGSIFQQEVKQTRRKPAATGNRADTVQATPNTPAVHTARPQHRPGGHVRRRQLG